MHLQHTKLKPLIRSRSNSVHGKICLSLLFEYRWWLPSSYRYKSGIKCVNFFFFCKFTVSFCFYREVSSRPKIVDCSFFLIIVLKGKVLTSLCNMNNTIGFRRLNAICDATFALVNFGKLNNHIYQSHYGRGKNQ